MDEALRRSIDEGHHRLLARMAGRWTGTARTWFEPGQLADTSSIEASVRALLDGMFAELSYEGTLTGHRMVGVAILGYDLREGWSMGWVDSVHNGTALMYSTDDGTGSATVLSVLGSYAAAPGVRWGWRTRIEMPADDRLRILHRNIPPETVGPEYDGVEFDLRHA